MAVVCRSGRQTFRQPYLHTHTHTHGCKMFYSGILILENAKLPSYKQFALLWLRYERECSKMMARSFIHQVDVFLQSSFDYFRHWWKFRVYSNITSIGSKIATIFHRLYPMCFTFGFFLQNFFFLKWEKN